MKKHQRSSGTAQKKSRPTARAEAERKLAEALGDLHLYARFVRERTVKWYVVDLQRMVRNFTSGDVGDFEQTARRILGEWETSEWPQELLDDTYPLNIPPIRW